MVIFILLSNRNSCLLQTAPGDSQVYILNNTFGHEVLKDTEGMTVLVRLGNKINVF